MGTTRNLPILFALSFAAALFGCDPEKTIQISYQRPAEYEISPSIKRLAVAPFNGTTRTSKPWAQIASDRLEAALAEHNRKYNRYELIDRKRLKQILDARDVKLFVGDDASASKVGKLADAHAMIYGNVTVATSDERATRQSFDFRTKSMKKVRYTRRHAMASVTFTLNETATGRTLTTVSTNQKYDSDKDQDNGKNIARALGVGSESLPPADRVFDMLIDRCVRDFLARVSPHEVTVEEKLSRGKTPIVGTGNRLAAAGDYDEALTCFQRAVKDRPDDHEAAFNAGVMHEAKGDLKQAEACYDRALKLKPKEQYIFARKRVRLEGDDQAEQ